MKNGLFLMFLLTAAWQDAWNKEVPIWLFWAGGIAAMGLFGWNLINDVLYSVSGAWMKLCVDCMAGSMLGIGLLICGKLTGGAIGSGDGWFFLVSGWFLGLKNAALLLCGGILFCGSWALGVFCWKRVHCNENAGKMTLPFLPFVALSWFGMIAVGWIDR